MRLLELLDELSRLEPEGISVDVDGDLEEGDVKVPIDEQGFTRGQLWDIVAYMCKRCEERGWEWNLSMREVRNYVEGITEMKWVGEVGVVTPYYTESHTEDSETDFCTPLVEAYVKAVRKYQKVEQED